MMSREEIRTLTRAIPFKPFRLFISNGESYDIMYPEMILTSYDAAHIGYSSNWAAIHEVDRVRIVGLNHIVKIEPVELSGGVTPTMTAA
jgi:hypothetical protein